MGKRVIKQSKASRPPATRPTASSTCGCGCLPVGKKKR